MMTLVRHARPALSMVALTLGSLALVVPASAQLAPYGPPFSFAVLAGSTVTNTGPTVITGDVGLSPGTAVVGFPPGLANGVIHAADAVSAQGQADLLTAYTILSGLPSGSLVSGDIGGRTLQAGTYTALTSLGITGDLVLDGQGNPNAVFVFQIGSTLTTASASRVQLVNGANAANVYFQVGSSATLGTATEFRGRILALTSITLNTGASINCGAALARNGAVTLDTNVISICLAAALVDVEDVLDEDELPTSPVVVPVTPQVVQVARVIDDFVANGGTLPIAFQALTTLEASALAVALQNLSGEVATGVAPAAAQGMDTFLDTVMTSRQGPGVLVASGNDDDNTVSVMGYMPVTPAPRVAALEAFDGQKASTKDWSVWLAALGGYSVTRGDAAIPSHDRTVQDFGIAAGFERQLDPYTMLGVSISKGGANFAIADDYGSGTVDTYQGAIYGRTELEDTYVAAVIAYGYHNVTTERVLTFAGYDRFNSAFSAQSLAGEIEVGHRLGMFTPYASIRAQSFSTPAYAETTTAGSSIFALAYDGQTVVTARAELGVKADWTMDFEGGDLTLNAGVGVAQDFGGNSSKEASFQNVPGSKFTVEGARADQTSLLLSVGMDVAYDNGFGFGASVGADLSPNTTSYKGTARLTYRW